ncbi:MAG: hypothetical protein ACXVNM_10500 [Bacteroidia bacterium]
MTRLASYITLFLLLVSIGHSQTRVIKPAKKKYPKSTNLGIGASMTRSVIYLNRNVKEDNDARGYSFSLIYGGSRMLRTSIEYTHFRSINIEPTWYNIKASTIEANIHIIARFKKTNAFFYPLFGISYNMFSGYFTGRNDFLNLSQRYPVNTNVSTNWFGVNVGTGYEHYIKPFSFFVDYKMRVGESDKKQLNIMDVCFTLGIRCNFIVPSIYKIFRGTRSRYFLDTENVEK